MKADILVSQREGVQYRGKRDGLQSWREEGRHSSLFVVEYDANMAFSIVSFSC